MSAAPKIPDALLSEVAARYQKGWSLRRIAAWLSAEEQLVVSRTAVLGALSRVGMPEPDALDDVRAELIEEAPENLHDLHKLQVEREDVLLSVIEKSLAREDALIIMKLIAQQERVLLWKLRMAGLRAPSRMPMASTERTESEPPSKPADSAPVTPAAAPPSSVRRPVAEVSRNAPCPCGSGRKHKKCCGQIQASAVTHAVTDRVAQMAA